MSDEQVVDSQDPLADSFENNSEGQLDDSSQADPAAQAGADDPTQQVVEEFEFGGLPFKDKESAITGHKNLQTEHLRVKTQLFKLQRDFKQVLPLLQNLKNGGTEEEKESVDDFLNRFVKDPKGTLSAFNKPQSDPRLSSIMTELAANRVTTAAHKFTDAHPELTADDEAAIEQILMANPRLTDLGDNATTDDIMDSLETALSHLIKSDPASYANKLATIKNTKEADLNSAKVAAGVGSKGGSIADGQATGDEFDDILTSETERMALYNR